MSATRPTTAQVHQAGRHLAVAEALLRGVTAKLRGAQTYIEVGEHVALVKVATKNAWIIGDVDEFTALTCDRAILINVSDTRDFYIVDANQLRADVRKRHQEFLERVGGTRPRNPDSKNHVIQLEHVNEWQDRWDLLT
ncbi:hypothetical protein [Streptomyces sp. NPDC006996]|uniref:hypothetical protein n=1 Tax=Streptomyces sp. NPDC006996 TaxID=3156908 RepID=UPI0033C77A82